MPLSADKSWLEQALNSFKSDLAFHLYAFHHNTPRGFYKPIGKTPGTIKIPSGYNIIVSPLELTPESLPLYTKDISSQGIEAVYLSGVRNRDLLEGFCKSNKHIRHIVLDSCGWELAPIELLDELKFLEVRSNNILSNLASVENIPSLDGIIVIGSNNIFSKGIPSSTSVEQLLLYSSACLSEKLIDCLGDHFPNLRVLHMNNCWCSSGYDTLDLSPLKKLHLHEFQAVGTRVIDPNGEFQVYCQELNEISAYIEKLGPQSTEALFRWTSTHNLDLKELCKIAPCIKSLVLNSCRDIDDLFILSGFAGLESLVLAACPNIYSLEPITTLDALRSLSVKDCPKVANYRCLAKCRTLDVLEISQGDNGILPPEIYREQLADLYLDLPRGCSWRSDVSEHDLEVLIEEIPQFFKSLKEELQCSSNCPCHAKRCVNA